MRIIVLLLGLGINVVAGVCPALAERRNDFQLFAGYSPASPTLIGTETGRRFVEAGISYSYLCWSWEHVSISYTAMAIPAAILLQPAQIAAVLPPGGPVAARVVPAHAVYGFGVTPVGATFDFERRRSVHPFVQIGLGIVASTEPIPENVPNATGLNFLIDVGGGVRWKRATAGYKFVHISNGFTTSFNPGVDNGVIYAGYSFVR